MTRFTFASTNLGTHTATLGFSISFVAVLEDYRLQEVIEAHALNPVWEDRAAVAEHFMAVMQWPKSLKPPDHDLDYAIACEDAMHAWRKRAKIYQDYACDSGAEILANTSAPHCWKRLLGRLNHLAFLMLCDAESVLKQRFLASHGRINLNKAVEELADVQPRMVAVRNAYKDFYANLKSLWVREKRWLHPMRHLDDQEFARLAPEDAWCELKRQLDCIYDVYHMTNAAEPPAKRSRPAPTRPTLPTLPTLPIPDGANSA